MPIICCHKFLLGKKNHDIHNALFLLNIILHTSVNIHNNYHRGLCLFSAQVPVTMKEIARAVKESGLYEQFRDVDTSEAMNWLKAHCPKAYEHVQGFIKAHGHRSIEEFELITETWGMKPEKFLAIIQVSQLVSYYYLHKSFYYRSNMM